MCSKTGLPLNAKHIVSVCRKVSAEIIARHDTVLNILLNNDLKQRGLIDQEQRWEDRKTVRTPRDEIPSRPSTYGPMSGRGRVRGARLRPDLVWLRGDMDGQWEKVVVDVKVTSTDNMNWAFLEKDDKYRLWATRETREKNVAKAVLVPLIVSHDSAVHRDTVRRWKDFAQTSRGWVRMAQNVIRYNVVIVGKFFNKGS